jgi:hypothetical protein
MPDSNIRMVKNTTSRPGLLFVGVLVAAAFLTIAAFGTWETARAQSGTANDREAVRVTVDSVFEGWRTLNLNLYMSAWDNSAVQYLKKGIARNYGQIRADRADAFAKYYRVDATWTADSIEIYGDKATVAVRYSMTFYKRDGKVIHENEKEFYVLKQYPDKSWWIVENYDYLPR